MIDPIATRPISGHHRLEHIDVARGIALLAMATYHFGWDLEFFGYIDPGTANTGFMKLYARCIASSFLVLVGKSLCWAHENGIKARSFAIRLAKIGGAALLITVATYFATPDSFIFFGILHHIALASVLGLVFLRLPTFAIFVAAAMFVGAPAFLRNEFFDQSWLLWAGLSEHPRLSNDYVPLFPWFGAVLAGIGLGRLISQFGLKSYLSSASGKNSVYRAFQFAGRHSLAIYLLHQPVLIALLWSFSQVMPAAADDPVMGYINECQQACVAKQSEAMCERFCACTLDRLMEEDLFDSLQLGTTEEGYSERITGIVEQCTFRSQ